MKITIIGAGNMGGAIARGLLSKGIIFPGDLTIADPSTRVRDDFAAMDSRINLCCDNSEAVKSADLVIVAVKPWLMDEVLSPLASVLDPSRHVIASIAAGLNFGQLSSILGNDGFTLMRVMPNTAIALGVSTTFISTYNASCEQENVIGAMFSALGTVLIIEEELMTAATALASCGIAYALRYVDAAARGGEQLGIPFEQSTQIVMQTIRGALALLEANNSTPQTEIDKVTTPSGITMKGLQEMERNGFSHSVIEGLKASR